MGFDAIWISPVIDNYDNGYHGYWARNMYSINSHFGSESDLKALVQACHDKNIWVLVDVVGNHVIILFL
jgi:alpha-amylase